MRDGGGRPDPVAIVDADLEDDAARVGDAHLTTAENGYVSTETIPEAGARVASAPLEASAANALSTRRTRAADRRSMR